MAKQTFTTGQVLTAAQMTSLQQTAMGGGEATAKTASYTLVAADAGTTIIMNSGSATTITVNTALFAAGDTVNIQNIGAGICTVTAGTATVNTAGSLALNQYEGGVLYFRSTSTATFFDYVQTGAVSPLTTKGDVWGYSTLDARIPVGANNTVLTADSAQALGVKWATPSTGGTYSTWTPIIKQNATSIALTVNSGATFANYTQVGKLTHAQFFVSMTGTGSANLYVTGNLPVTANKSNYMVGVANLYDSSSGLVYSAEIFLLGTTSFVLVGTSSNLAYLYLGDSGSAFTAALASGDQIYGSFTYESV